MMKILLEILIKQEIQEKTSPFIRKQKKLFWIIHKEM